MFLNEKMHIVFDNDKTFALFDRIVEYISMLLKTNYQYKFDKVDYEGSKYFNIEKDIPRFKNTFAWLNDDFEIRVHSDEYSYFSYWQDYTTIKKGKLSNAIFNIYLNKNDFDRVSFLEGMHHEFLHAYEDYNKRIKGKELKYYAHYDLFFEEHPVSITKILYFLYTLIPEERRAFLQNFYQSFKEYKDYKKCDSYKHYSRYKEIVEIYNELNDMQREYFDDYCKDKIAKTFNLSIKNFDKQLISFIEKNSLEMLKKMHNIAFAYNDGQLNEEEKVERLYLLKRKRILEREFKNKNINFLI